MDFEREKDTPQEEAFRREVRAWVQANLGGAGAPVDPRDLTDEQIARNREFLQRLGQKGWYIPAFPKEYGGGGLPPDRADIINEELYRNVKHFYNVRVPGDISIVMARATCSLGTEEQKRRWLPLIAQARIVIWEAYTEPEAGSDLPSLRTRAVREGDSYVINGTKTFIDSPYLPDYLLTLAQTNPEQGRHKDLSMIMVPAGTPGLRMESIAMLAGSGKRTVHFDTVRVPAANLIAGEGDGWRVFAGPFPGAPYVASVFLLQGWNLVEPLVRHCKEQSRHRRPLTEDPHVRDVLARAYIEARKLRLLHERNRWMARNDVPMTYHAAQVEVVGKLLDLELARLFLQVLGPQAIIRDPQEAPLEGELEYFHRHAILMLHPGGTVEIQKIRVFRGMLVSYPAK